MNPEEGELRPQLADRIGLEVEVEPLAKVPARAEVIRRREAFTSDPAAFVSSWQQEQEALRAQIRDASRRLARMAVPDDLYAGIAGLGLRLGATSHRADITVLQCAKALAALAGRECVELADVVDAGELALGHRLPRRSVRSGARADPDRGRASARRRAGRGGFGKSDAPGGEPGASTGAGLIDATPQIEQLDADPSGVLAGRPAGATGSSAGQSDSAGARAARG